MNALRTKITKFFNFIKKIIKPTKRFPVCDIPKDTPFTQPNDDDLIIPKAINNNTTNEPTEATDIDIKESV